jgi:hypothetical protein
MTECNKGWFVAVLTENDAVLKTKCICLTALRGNMDLGENAEMMYHVARQCSNIRGKKEVRSDNSMDK